MEVEQLGGINLEQIKNKRKESKATLQEMAELLGFSNPSAYLKYEDGTSDFKAKHLPILCRRFNCDVVELFFDESFADSAKNREMKQDKQSVELTTFLKDHFGEEKAEEALVLLSGFI
jgi:transcriptional regulator with XRE-family HTH domain